MKLKQSVLIMMAAALPVVSFAASEAIPVTKDTATVQAAQADTNKVSRNDLTHRFIWPVDLHVNLPYLLQFQPLAQVPQQSL